MRLSVLSLRKKQTEIGWDGLASARWVQQSRRGKKKKKKKKKKGKRNRHAKVAGSELINNMICFYWQ